MRNYIYIKTNLLQYHRNICHATKLPPDVPFNTPLKPPLDQVSAEDNFPHRNIQLGIQYQKLKFSLFQLSALTFVPAFGCGLPNQPPSGLQTKVLDVSSLDSKVRVLFSSYT